MQNDTTSNEKKTASYPDGYCMGQSTTDKIAFYGATPVVQRSGSVQAAVATTAATTTTPYGFSTLTQANAIVTLVNEIRATLVANGMIAGA
jgi:UDP-N-acetyl-D-mannosaminuronic acid transferase (WecB/TagA/CpsF family)